ncbi:helix-turn-helix domain-containing protein [Bacillus circulans]|uniref:phBC6A51 family helix-turn-helix protein n=1 Tax=Niallia circulans TaxID=1397 RepID=UPI001560AE02|nr:phBC6A51 family helix-turn-helix protein [Niallia circulans]NRG26138.1 helix-turn-helix domain-containing protein [Niallia circulans]
MLKAEQYQAIQYLAQPKNGGFTHEQIAEKVGVTRQTLFRWRQDIEFQDELRRELSRNTAEKMGDVAEAMYKEALKGNAAAAKLLYQTTGLLTDKLEIEDRTKRPAETTDIEAMKAKIAEMRNAGK